MVLLEMEKTECDAEWSIEHANEFALGVGVVNPEAEIFFTPSEGRNEVAARMLIEKGCDVFNGFVGWYEEIRVLEQAFHREEVVCAFSNILPREVSPEVIAAGMPEDLGELFSRILRGIFAEDELPDPLDYTLFSTFSGRFWYNALRIARSI